MFVSRKANVSRSSALGTLLYAGLITPAILLAVCGTTAQAGQLAANAFQTYNAAAAAAIQAGPTALFAVSVDSLRPTQLNEGLTEVGKKTAGFDLLSPSQLQANLLTDIEPVVIGPGGQLYLTDGHHTLTALEDSIYGASNPTVFVDVIANYSNLTTAQFFATLQAQNLLLPLNDGVPQTVNTATGAPFPTALTGLTSDVYRGLEYSILKNKSSTLFTTAANITGAVGASTPGLDKMTGFYEDFFEAAAYRNANGGLGLPTISPGDVALATQWNLNPASVTTLPNVAGTVTAAQLPGFILANSITLNGVISNATLATGALDGNGTFTGLTTINAGTAAAPITIGTPNTGFVLQLGADKGNTVTLSGANTYTGGTSLLAGTLIVANDASLGAAVPAGATIDPANIKTSVQAANGIVFNSLDEGAATLQIGTAAGNGTSTFTTLRPIAVGGETATIDLNGYVTTLSGPIVSLGVNNIGIGNASGASDLTIDDNSANLGVLVLSGNNSLFYGNLIIGNTNAPTVKVMDDAALGNTVATAGQISQIDLNSGTLQAGASFTALERNIFLGSGSTIDVNGFTTSWGTLTDVQRALVITNSNKTTAGAATFANLTIGGTATLQLSGGKAGETVTLTNGIARSGAGTLIIQPTSATSLGTATETLRSGVGTASLIDGIAPAWIVTNNGGSKSVGPYDFVTYGANGYVKATYTGTTLGTAPTAVVALAANAAPVGNVSAFALNTEGKTITLGAANSLTLGDGTDAAGLILATGSAISQGTLAFGGSEGVIWLSGTNATISSKITGSNGLTFAGSGAVALSTAAAVSGLITIDSGTVTLAGANIFGTDAAGINLADTKSKPAPATLSVTANNTLTTLSSVGNNSVVLLSNGAALTVGDTTNNLSSVLNSTITETGAAVAGALTLNGSGLFDVSGGSKNALGLLAGSSVVLNNSAQLRAVANEFATNFGIVLNGTSQLQFAQNGGGVFANAVSGTGSLELIGGTLKITGTANTYSGGTFVEIGAVLDITTANLPAVNPNITNAGGLVVFDQATNGTYNGVISDGAQLGVGATLSGSFDKDDSTGANAGNVILAKAQTFTGATTVEAGTLTLGAVDTLATSSGVDLGRVGGGATATLALSANNTIQALSSEAANTTSVALGANTLTINTAATTAVNFGGSIGGTGGLVKSGAGTQALSGVSTFSGATTVTGGLLGLASGGAITQSASLTNGGTFQIDQGASATFMGEVTNTATINTAGTLAAASFANSGTLTSTGTVTATGVFTNTGTVMASGTFAAANVTNASIFAVMGPLGGLTSFTQQAGTFDLGGNTVGLTTFAFTGGVAQNGTLTVSGTDTVQAGTITATLAGTAALTKTGTGTVDLTAANTYSGGTTLSGGTLAVGSNTALGTGQVAMADGTTLAFLANGLTIANPFLFTGTGDPTVDTGAFTETLSSAITGTGALTKAGTGTLVLTGASTYTGATSVAQGVLEVDGSIVSGTTVQSGAALTGSGTIGGLTVASGATLSPGSGLTVGTLTAIGPTSFAANSFFDVKVTPTTNDRLNTTGLATIAGGTVQALIGNFNFPNVTRVTILTATDGVSGQFAAATSSSAFLTPTLSYDANDVFLTLARNDVSFASVGATSNQRAVGQAIQNAANALVGGPANPNGAAILNNLILGNGAAARSTFDMLSGEGLTGAQNLAFTANKLFTSAMQDQSAFFRPGGGVSVSVSADTVVPLAYAGETLAFPSPIHLNTEAPRPWRAWSTGFGGGESLRGNAGVGATGQTDSIGGGAAGIDYRISPDLLIGVAGGGTDGNFYAPGAATQGEVKGGHAGVYATATFGPAYVQSSVAFSSFENTTRRQVQGFGALAGETENGNFGSREIRARIEAGRRLNVGLGAVGVTPFVALEIAELWTSGFTEQAGGGGPGVLGLAVPGQSLASVPGIVGARFDTVYAIGNGMTLSPTVSLAYVHDFAPQRSLQASLISLPAASFIVDGARQASNAAQVKAGGELAVTQSVTLFGTFEGEFSGEATSYAGKGGIRIGW
ncbi:autotransporter domain-containing protein [Beijerinckia sp. L45]|uniref:autotransporter domain-containing protein n=1 Tax=Beijerinckia sp. L45 TaxID=1641855 RepID=UPI00131B52E0|nr:autotransporter domain-containing protein [Beijerinckia sp. L45]